MAGKKPNTSTSMELRRRSNASLHNDNSSTDEAEDEESSKLLDNGRRDEHADSGAGAGALRTASGPSQPYHIRPLIIIFSIIGLAFILFASLKLAGYFPSFWYRQNVLQGDINQQKTAGIFLHPEDHAYQAPKTIAHKWTITSGIISPDGVRKQVYLVNGQFPGPTIECRSGDRLVIEVINALHSEDVAIHWHGLEMRNANAMDGAVGITQCPIPPTERFAYEFDVGHEEEGTFWWHAHSQVQRGDGMYGGLVVHKPVDKSTKRERHVHEKEILLMIGDWYHRSAEDVLEWYTSVRGFGNEPVPDSLLINGAGKFNCDMAVPARPVECVDVNKPVLDFPAKESVKLRVINTGSLAGFSLQSDIGTLTPISVDSGHRIFAPPVNSVGIIYPGERLDLISTPYTDSISGFSSLHISLDPENFKYTNSALQPNQSFPILPLSDVLSSSREPLATDTNPTAKHFDLSTATSYTNLFLSEKADQTILLYAKTQKLSIKANRPTGFMNRTIFAPQTPPLITLLRDAWDENQLVPFIPFPSASPSVWIDIIINNLDDGSHPFHLHGYSFYVLASSRSEHGWGSYNPYSAAGTASAIKPVLNLKDPVKKDTVAVPRRGYVVIRLLADNPGIWMLHCHVLFHQASGMAMSLHVGLDEGNVDVDENANALCRA